MSHEFVRCFLMAGATFNDGLSPRANFIQFPQALDREVTCGGKTPEEKGRIMRQGSAKRMDFHSGDLTVLMFVFACSAR